MLADGIPNVSTDVADGSQGGGKKRKRLPDRGEPRGKEREEQVRAVVRACERAEREARGVLHPMLDLGGWISGIGVPSWSRRDLLPGEWRERECVHEPLSKRRRLEPTGGTSRFAKRRLLAEAAGVPVADATAAAHPRGGGVRPPGTGLPSKYEQRRAS